MRPAPQFQRRVTLHRASGPSDDRRTIAAIAEDGSRFPIDKMEAHERGVLHDAISVFIFDGEDMLIQQRAESKYHCGGKWANACCTHPDWDENAAGSAERRLFEELGVRLPLREVGLTTYRADVGNGLIEHERVRVFRGDADRATLGFDLNPEEVRAVRWASPAILMEEALTSPNEFAPWFKIYLQRWAELGL